MYIASFYSYKGGVGRTLALANVATHLVRRGRRVLLVDFDLEAPGLDTFKLFKPRKPTPGIVEYVSNYLALHETANVSDYCYEVDLPNRVLERTIRAENGVVAGELTREDLNTDEPKDTGRLWIMPAGRRDEFYSKLLQNIDWGLLYAEHNGYLMFEDMKEQWRQNFNPDYVLIDSRTGHTDVGGICTRHLPNAVVLLFFPNDQNLIGLDAVVRDIRDEAKPPRNKNITLHFVMSNVPDLDDEDRILRDRRTEFQRRLHFKRPLIIHHYNSLSLLNQAIFCEERPRSRFAEEYRQIAREIIKLNPEDKEGAMIFMDRYADERRRGTLSPLEGDLMLKTIEERHAKDGDILTQLALLRIGDGSPDDARRILARALDMELSSPRTLVRRAQCRLVLLKDEEGAETDAGRALRQPGISESEAVQAFRMLADLQERQAFREAAELPLVDVLPSGARLFIGSRLNRDVAELRIGIRILKSVIDDPATEDGQRRAARANLALSLIGIGAFSDAVSLLEEERAVNVAVAFNYAMARWALSGECDRALFQTVIDLDPDGPEEAPGANYAQCLAVAHWATGNRERADEFLLHAKSIVDGWRFSCWRYLEVSEQTFREDAEAIARMFAGEHLQPEFFSRRQQLSLQQGLLDS